jgi:hypothetical protein
VLTLPHRALHTDPGQAFAPGRPRASRSECHFLLHAFNQKNVRRTLLRTETEHSIEKTEDAVTSMVFSPLAFMEPEAALTCLTALIGPEGTGNLLGRMPTEHDVEFWPKGLKARGRDGIDRRTRASRTCW